MTDLYTLVCHTAAKLQAEGKTPSLALVRANAGKGLDPAALFSAYQQWRNQLPTEQPSTAPAISNTTDNGCTAAEPFKDNEINRLQTEITLLHRKVDQLILLVEALGSPQDTDHVRR
ncbi:MAG: hypothetical protein ACK4NN_06560 [Rheinheimera sp.]|jgi:hypothetical protein